MLHNLICALEDSRYPGCACYRPQISHQPAMQPKKSSLKPAPSSWAENGRASGQKCLRAISNPFYFSPSCSASSVCVGLLLVLLLSCYSGTQLMPALTLWLKTSLSLSFFERLKGGVVWSFCLNKCLNSFSWVWSPLFFFFFSPREEGEICV